MATYKEQLNYISSIYIKSLESEKIKSNLSSLKTIFSDKDSNTENKELALHLFLCCYLKMALLELRDKKFDVDISNNYLENINKYINIAKNNKLENATITLENGAKLISFLKNIYEDYNHKYSLIYDIEGNIVLNDANVAKDIKDYANNQIEKLDKHLIYNPFTDKIIFIDLKEISINLFKVLKEKSIEIIKTISDKNIKLIFNDNCQILADEMANKYEYYPGLSNDINKNNGFFVLFSPLIIEVKLATYYFEITNNKRFVVVDALDLKVKDYKSIINAISILDYNVLVLNIDNIAENRKKELLKELFELSKTRFVFIHNPYANIAMYDEYVNYAKETNILKSYEMSYFYINFPPFDSLIEILENRNIVDNNETKTKIKDNLKFMGYYGLNVLINNVINDRWFEMAKNISNNNYQKVKHYLENLPSQIQLIDFNWGTIEAGKNYISKEAIIYDYDNIHGVNVVNIKKIMKAELSLNQKIGVLVQYILLAGNDQSYYYNLDEQERQYRVKLATELVYVVYGFDYLPEVVFEKQKQVWGGLNVNGGVIIKYSVPCLKDFEYSMHVICHETRHTFQHYATKRFNNSFADLYNVSKNMVGQWAENESHYIELKSNVQDDDFFAYKYQVVEADANAFADDCRDGAAEAYNQINFE